MIKVNYDLETTLVKGYYPDSIKYSSIPEPFVEIEDNAQILDKQMCVKNGIYQEYIKPFEEQLQDAKNAKIAEMKEKRDVENIKPLVRNGNLINPTTMEILPSTIQFYFVAIRHPTNQASDAGTLLEQAQKRGLIPYFTKNVATNDKAVIALTAELSTNIENHLLNRNATNYYHYGQLEAQINNATTIEQVEAITW